MKSIFQEKIHSRWLILLIDQFILLWAVGISLVLLHQVSAAAVWGIVELSSLFLYHIISITVFMILEIHTGIIRYSNTKDMVRIFLAVFISSVIFGLLSRLILISDFNLHLQWFYKILLLNFFISSSLLILFRIGVKSLFVFFSTLEKGYKGERLLIYGSDRDAILVKQTLEASAKNRVQVMGFLDDHPDTVNKFIAQKKVYHSSALASLSSKHGIEKLVIGHEVLFSGCKKKVIENCVALGIKVMVVPPSNEWLYGKLQLHQLQDLKIEDLLQRAPILLEQQHISEQLQGKRILVTGAAGSIGSELIRQLLEYSPEYLIACDQAESPLHELQLEMEAHPRGNRVKIFLGSIRNQGRMKILFERYHPQLIFHAAAYKHVPMMENHAEEAILTNIYGTKNIADLAISYGIEKFVMISTDKAVKPGNIMGASKRVAEIYIQSLQENVTGPEFITTRFGNVLGSNGSVIPRFQSQIERGGPVTVTHPEVTRYFMTISESVQLVLEAAAMGKGGEIFMFDMGPPIKIIDLAVKMIKLAGLRPETDIKIVYSGLRPGEKLYEELLHQEEHAIPTYHPKIKLAKTIIYSHSFIAKAIEEILDLNKSEDAYDTIRKLKAILPEFISNNSIYEELDN